MNKSAVTVVIFGGTGDLARRKLVPALFDLYLRGYLPKHFRVVGITRRELTTETYRQLLEGALKQALTHTPQSDVAAFLSHLYCYRGVFEEADSYVQLHRELLRLDEAYGQCPSRLYYLATPPASFSTIVHHLATSGLSQSHGGWQRIMVEKPFGTDGEDAQRLDEKLGALFAERDIFRIDHYLAKAAVQNLVAFRFSNALFEHVWSREHIASVHIKLYERGGAEERGAFYDALGALRDVGQNHMLQLLALSAMENPPELHGEAIRSARLNVLKKLRVFTEEEVVRFAVRAQYDGYRQIDGVEHDSVTETYFKIAAFIDSTRWSGVPFILESGKRLGAQVTEINVHFKPAASGLCHTINTVGCENQLTIGITPTQHITLRLWGRKSGFSNELEAHDLSFKMPEQTQIRTPDGYEKVLYDGLVGDSTLFMRTEELAASWNFIAPIMRAWSGVPLTTYTPGSLPTALEPSAVQV